MTPTLVVMAAGAGSRFGGPKQLEPVGPGGERLLDYAIFDAARAGFGRVVLIVPDEHVQAFTAVSRIWAQAMPVEFAVQRIDDVPAAFAGAARAKPWGTTQAVLAARHLLHGPFAVVNADDFYGDETYRLAAVAARTVPSDGVTIVAMRLDRTLSAHGPVTRAICQTRGRSVLRLDEVRGIIRTAHGIVGGPEHERIALTGHEPVSMNCWVCPAEMTTKLSERFAAFLRDAARPPEAECMLPETMNALLSAGEIAIEAVETTGAWFGLTHAADRPIVVAGLEALVARGVYPRLLWS